MNARTSRRPTELCRSWLFVNGADEAALALLRVPTAYADDVLLAQTSLWEAAKVLQDSMDQAKRLKQLERENTRLKKVVADQALDIAILKEVSEGNF